MLLKGMKVAIFSNRFAKLATCSILVSISCVICGHEIQRRCQMFN